MNQLSPDQDMTIPMGEVVVLMGIGGLVVGGILSDGILGLHSLFDKRSSSNLLHTRFIPLEFDRTSCSTPSCLTSSDFKGRNAMIDFLNVTEGGSCRWV